MGRNYVTVTVRTKVDIVAHKNEIGASFLSFISINETQLGFRQSVNLFLI